MHRDLRLKKRQDFKKVYNYGKSLANRELVLYVRNNISVNDYRIGISVSKKVGNAVVRNRVKRLINEVLRAQISLYGMKKNIDIIIIARNPTANMDYQNFEKSIKHVFRKANLFEKKLFDA